MRKSRWDETRRRTQLTQTALVAYPLSLSLEELRALPDQVQTTEHVCVQSWSGVGKWRGVSVAEILARCEPSPEARYVKSTSYGLDQFTYGGKPRRPFYEVLDLLLPLVHGAPLPLRVETQLGYKMVKYLRSIELVAEYHTSGDGQGGSREDTMFDGRRAEI
ncbi:MAG: molybdopterin-dependent oxidoreductase [Solirubrobacteraceae bacterium]